MRNLMKLDQSVGVLLLSSAVALTATTASAADLEAVENAAVETTQEDKHKCNISFVANITSDYIFRGISFSDNGPAAQTFTTLSCGIVYGGLFTANVEFPGASANVELTPYVGIAPSYKGFDFNIIGYYYTFPDFGLDGDYFEIEAGVKRQVTKDLNLGIRYSHAFFEGFFGLEDTNTVQFDVAYNLPDLKFTLPELGEISPSISGGIGYETQQLTAALGGGNQDYVYWNAGASFAFRKNYKVDVRYWDTDEGLLFCQAFNTCSARAVGTFSVAF